MWPGQQICQPGHVFGLLVNGESQPVELLLSDPLLVEDLHGITDRCCDGDPSLGQGIEGFDDGLDPFDDGPLGAVVSLGHFDLATTTEHPIAWCLEEHVFLSLLRLVDLAAATGGRHYALRRCGSELLSLRAIELSSGLLPDPRLDSGGDITRCGFDQ